MRHFNWRLIVVVISIVVIMAASWLFLTWRLPITRDILNDDFGKPIVWAGGGVIMSSCTISTKDILVSSDAYYLTESRSNNKPQSIAAFYNETLVFWSGPERELVILDKNGVRRVLSGQQIPASQDVVEIVPFLSGLIVNTKKYIGGSGAQYARSSAYRLDLKSGNISIIDDALSARGDSTSDTIAVITKKGDIKIIYKNGEETSIPNIRVDISNWMTWDFDPGHQLLAVADGYKLNNLRVFQIDGNLKWQTETSTRVLDVVFQSSRNELWVALEAGGWDLEWSLAVYDLQGLYHGLRFKHVGLQVHRPLMPAEDYMKDILISNYDKKYK